MNDDPAIERIREIRNIISEEFDHDPKKLVAYYMERQKKIKILHTKRKNMQQTNIRKKKTA